MNFTHEVCECSTKFTGLGSFVAIALMLLSCFLIFYFIGRRYFK